MERCIPSSVLSVDIDFRLCFQQRPYNLDPPPPDGNMQRGAKLLIPRINIDMFREDGNNPTIPFIAWFHFLPRLKHTSPMQRRLRKCILGLGIVDDCPAFD